MRQGLQHVIHSSGPKAMFLRFAGVATAISLIDAGGLLALHQAGGVGLLLARVFSYTAAITAGYFLNRYFTFHTRTSDRSTATDLVRFYGIHGLGGALNYGVFACTLLAGRAVIQGQGLDLWLSLLGIWLGGIAGMCFNFFLSSRMVFDQEA